MPLIQSSQDHLHFAYPEPTPAELLSARALITASLSPETQQTPHPRLPVLRSPSYSPALTSEHTRLATTGPSSTLNAIDLTRYEEPSAPTTTTSTDTDKEAWTTALRTAYTSTQYLQGRVTNLSLLETYGKNAWLVSNSGLEDILRDLEAEVKGLQNSGLEVERERRERQGLARGELEALEAQWREGVGRVIEVQAAAEGIRREILERRRRGGVKG